MRSQTDHMDTQDLGTVPEPTLIRVHIPKGFQDMDLNSRIEYMANELKSLESEYPAEQGSYMRHTSLARIEGDEILYLVEYVPVMDSEY